MMPPEAVAVRIRPGGGLAARSGAVVALLGAPGSLEPVLDALRAASADVGEGTLFELLAVVRDRAPGAAAVVLLGEQPALVLRGEVECRFWTDREQRVSGTDATQVLSLPVAARRIEVALRGEEGAAHPGSDLVAGAVPAAGFAVEPVAAPAAPPPPLPVLEPPASPAPPAEPAPPAVPPPPAEPTALTPAVVPPPPPPPPPAPPPVAEPAPSFVAIPLHADGGDEVDHAPPLPVAGDAAAEAGPRVRGIACAVGHVNRLEAKYCSACGRRLQGTVRLVEGPRPLLGIVVFEDGSTFGLDRDYVIGREPESDPRVAAGEVAAMRLEDPERGLSRVHAELRLVEWDTTVVDLGSANGTYVLPPGAPQWVRVERDVPARLEDGWRVAVGRRTFTFEQH